MKRSQSSLTAAGIAIVRALESEKPADERLIYDPYALRFVSSAMFNMVKFFFRIGYGERRGPGVWEFLIARERYIDDYLQARLEEGLKQLVILGAGFDARAYRFDALQRDNVRVFELDHPATQAAKLQRLDSIFGKQPAHVTYVGIDFDNQTLGQRLAECGYDEGRKTLFIWQGVTEYLTLEAVDATLAFIRQHSAAGSSVIFDYLDPSILSGAQGHGEVRSTRRYGRMTGENLVFGIPIAEAEQFLGHRGFVEVENADHDTLERQYFRRGPTSRSVAGGYGILTGRVPA